MIKACVAGCDCVVSKYVVVRQMLLRELCVDAAREILQTYINNEYIGISVSALRLINKYKHEAKELNIVTQPKTLARDLLLIDGLHCVNNFYSYLCSVVTKYVINQAIRSICSITTYPIVISKQYMVEDSIEIYPTWIHVCDVMDTDAADRGETPSQPYRIEVNKKWLINVVGEPFSIISRYLDIRLGKNTLAYLHPDREVVVTSITLIRAISGPLIGRDISPYTILCDQYKVHAVRINKKLY